MVDTRSALVFVTAAAAALLPSCFPFEKGLAECKDSGRCGDGTSDGGDAGEPDAGIDYEVALWLVPPEAPTQYLVQGKTVLDQQTGLVWQLEPGPASTWDRALTQCENLNTLGFGGAFSGWRLPKAIELLSIVDSTKRSPAINPTAFPSTPSAPFWSSSIDGRDAGTAWEVAFDCGDARLFDVAQMGSVRCVRSTPPSSFPHPRYPRDPDAGTVRDEVTALTWQAGTASVLLSVAEGKAYCADAGWRLPAKKELETLVNRRGDGSMIDPSPFPNTQAGYFWSSTPVVVTGIFDPMPPSNWGVDFSNDQTTRTPDTFLRNVRCVH